MRRCPHVPARKGRLAFTLLEVIGVVAILAILASLLTPAVIQSIDQAARVRDVSELKAMADAFQSAVRRQGWIPDEPKMRSFVATEMGVAVGQVSNNSRNVPRLFFPDPNLVLGSAGLPYIQSSYPGGIANPVLSGPHLRLLIISSLNDLLPPTNSFSFDITWNTPDGTVPSDWTWQGRGEDLTIQRVDFTPLFHRVILNNMGANPYPGFSIETGGNVCFTNLIGTISDSFFLDKTVICLHDNSNPRNLQLKAILQDDTSYVFEKPDTTWLWLGSLK